MTHRADPVEVVGDGSWARCSCGKAVQRVLNKSAHRHWPKTTYRDYHWMHAHPRSAVVPVQLRGLA